MKSSSFLRPMDYSEMDSRFSNEQAIRYNDFIDETITYEEIKPLLSKLPPKEIDLIELYYNEKKNQKDIAKMFGVTQGAISSRLSRAKKRLKFIRNLPKISNEEIDKLSEEPCAFEPLEIEIIKFMIETTCQSKTAQLLNEKFKFNDPKSRMTQVKVRHRFEKCLLCLKHEMKKRPDLKKYYQLLLFIKCNLYALHEVKLPHFDRGNAVLFSLYTL